MLPSTLLIVTPYTLKVEFVGNTNALQPQGILIATPPMNIGGRQFDLILNAVPDGWWTMTGVRHKRENWKDSIRTLLKPKGKYKELAG